MKDKLRRRVECEEGKETRRRPFQRQEGMKEWGSDENRKGKKHCI